MVKKATVWFHGWADMEVPEGLDNYDEYFEQLEAQIRGERDALLTGEIWIDQQEVNDVQERD